MNLIKYMFDLGKIKPDHLMAYLFICLGLVVPGVGYIYLTDPQLFYNLDFAKLLLLTIFYSLPIVLSAFLISTTEHLIENEKPIDTKQLLAATGLLSLLLYYILSLTYFWGSGLSYIATLYGGSAVMVILFRLWGYSKKRSSKK